MGKSKTTKSYIGNENIDQCPTQILCDSCCYNNPINLVCTDQKCNKSDQLQAICATCHYNLYHSSVSLETYLKKIQAIFQESLAIIEVDQKKLLHFQESLNQTYFMIENLKLKTYEQLQEQENQRQQLLSLISNIKNLDENKQISPQTLKDKIKEISKVLILDSKASEENPLRTTINFYREFVYQCEMEIWIKFNRYFTQKRDWVVKTEEDCEINHNTAQNKHNIHPNFQVLNNTGNTLTLTKADQQIRQNSQRDKQKKDLLQVNQMEIENLNSKNEDSHQKKKQSFCDEINDSKEDEEVQFEVERNPDDYSEKSEQLDDIEDEDDEDEEEDEDDGDFQYKQRRRKSNTHGNNTNNFTNGHSNNIQNGAHSLRNKSISTYSRYQEIHNNNDFNQSSSHSNGSTIAVPKGNNGIIRKIRELSVKEKQTILQEYDQTGDIRSISNKYNIKYRRLYNFIQNSRGPNNQSIRQYSDEDKQLIYNDYIETKNVREVANKWKLNYDSLYSFIRYKKQK